MPQRRGGRRQRRDARAARPERNLSERIPNTKPRPLVLAGQVTTLGDAIRTGLQRRAREIVQIRLLKPAPQGVGLAVGDVAKSVLRLAGITDAWGFTKGHTKTTVNFALATFEALRKTVQVKVRTEQTERLKIKAGAEQVFVRKIEAPPTPEPVTELPEEIAVEGETLTEEPTEGTGEGEAPEE